jgi:hypothetical protein
MVVDDLNRSGIAILPHKANPKLIVQPNTMLPKAITAQLFQTIAGWRAQIVQRRGAIEKAKLAAGDGEQVRGKSFWKLA